MADLFDILKGALGKEKGIQKAVDGHLNVFDEAKKIAIQVALSRPNRTITIDDVFDKLVQNGFEPSDLGKAAGGVFRGDQWEMQGYVKSRRTTNHRRPVGVWHYRG